MAKIPEYYSFGGDEQLDIERLPEILKDMYKTLAIAVNKKPDVYERNTNGLTSDTFLSNGDININSSTGAVEFLVAHPTQSTVTWNGGGGAINVAAYVMLFIGTTTIESQFNVSSVIGAGTLFQINFTNPMANNKYAVFVSAEHMTSFFQLTRSTTFCSFRTVGATGADHLSVLIINNS